MHIVFCFNVLVECRRPLKYIIHEDFRSVHLNKKPTTLITIKICFLWRTSSVSQDVWLKKIFETERKVNELDVNKTYKMVLTKIVC